MNKLNYITNLGAKNGPVGWNGLTQPMSYVGVLVCVA